MVSKSGVTFIKYNQGDTIGESDSLLGLTRDCKAVAEESCILYIIQVDVCQEIFIKYPLEYEKLKDNAILKRELHKQKLKIVDKKAPFVNPSKFAAKF